MLLSNPRGLWRVDMAQRRLTPVSRAQGLPEVQFDAVPSALRQGDDVVFMVGDGILRVTAGPSAPTAAGPVMALRWAPLRYLHDDTPSALAPAVDALAFGPLDHELAIGARLLSFVEPREHRYRFRIEGFDAEIAAELSRRSGCALAVEESNASRLWPTLSRGELALSATLGYLPERYRILELSGALRRTVEDPAEAVRLLGPQLVGEIARFAEQARRLLAGARTRRHR